MEKAFDLNEQLINSLGKKPRKKILNSKSLAYELKNVTEMNDKVMHEAQSYKMSLEASSVQSIALERARSLHKKLCHIHPHHRTKQEIQKNEYLKTDLRSLISLRKVENMNHISLKNLLQVVIRRLFIPFRHVRNGVG